MQLRKIYELLDSLSPFALQESWDNSGLLVGAMSDEVEAVYLSLDVDTTLLESVAPHSLLIVHHPLIFKGLKELDFNLFPSNLLQQMIKKDISLIAMHTNFDTTHLNKYVASQILGYTDLQCEGHICYFDVNCSFDALCSHVKQRLGLDILRCTQSKTQIKRCALTTGSGGDLITHVRADCFLSGDFKYHQALAAKENNLCLIDIGHYESERYFGECLAQNLKNFPLKVIMSNSNNPFEYK